MEHRLSFSCDYLEGAHPAILQRLCETNFAQTAGYGTDEYCESAREKIRAACGAPNAEIHFLVGGTQTNATVIDALLRYYVNGGGFKHVMDGELDGMATEQAYYALTAYYRFLTGKTNLYDMTDTINKGGDPVEVEPTVPATTEPAEVEPAKTNFPWWILVICVVGGCGLGMVIAIVIIPKFKKKD